MKITRMMVERLRMEYNAQMLGMSPPELSAYNGTDAIRTAGDIEKLGMTTPEKISMLTRMKRTFE